MIHKATAGWRWLDHGLSVKVFCESGLWLSLFLGVFWHHIWPRLLHLWLVGDISGLHRSYFRRHSISNCLSNDFWEGLFEYRKIDSFLFKILMQSLMEIWINCKARLLKGQFTSDIKVQSLFTLLKKSIFLFDGKKFKLLFSIQWKVNSKQASKTRRIRFFIYLSYWLKCCLIFTAVALIHFHWKTADTIHTNFKNHQGE